MLKNRFGALSAQVLLALALALPGCGGGDEEATPAQTGGSFEKASSSQPAGAAVFKQFCATCHGATGSGDGVGAAALPVKPRNLTSEAYKFVDIAAAGSELQALINYIEVGKVESGMPPWKGVISDQQIHDVAAFVQALRPRPNFVEEQPAPETDQEGAPAETGETTGGG